MAVGLGFEEELVGEKFEVGVVVDEGWNLLLGEDGVLALLEGQRRLLLRLGRRDRRLLLRGERLLRAARALNELTDRLTGKSAS